MVIAVHQVAVHYHQLPDTIYDLSLDDFDEMLEYMNWDAKEQKKAQDRAKRNAK